jgi:hypothetical protein
MVILNALDWNQKLIYEYIQQIKEILSLIITPHRYPNNLSPEGALNLFQNNNVK